MRFKLSSSIIRFLKTSTIVCVTLILFACGTITSPIVWKHNVTNMSESQVAKLRIWCDYTEGKFTIQAIDDIRDPVFLNEWCGTGWIRPGHHTLEVWGRQVHKWAMAGNGVVSISFEASPGGRYLLKSELESCWFGKCRMIVSILNEIDNAVIAGPIVSEPPK